MCNQIWLNYFLDDCHFDYITKSLKRNPGLQPCATTFMARRRSHREQTLEGCLFVSFICFVALRSPKP